MTIGKKLYELRTQKNMSQETLAELVSVSRQSVSKWETDQSVPELDKLFRLCDVFGVTLDELTGRTAPRNHDDTAVEVKNIVHPILNTVMPIALGAVSLLLSVVLFFVLCSFNDSLTSFIIALPFFVCGVVCLTRRGRIFLSYSVFLYFYFTCFYLWGYGVVFEDPSLIIGIVGAAASLACFLLMSIKTPIFQIKKRIPVAIGIVLWCSYALMLFVVVALLPDIFQLINFAWVVSQMHYNSWGYVMIGSTAFISAIKCALFVGAVTITSTIMKERKN